MDILDIAIAKKLGGGGSGINAAVQSELNKKVDKDYGEENEGKALIVGSDGNVGVGDIISTSKTAVTSEGNDGHVTMSFIDGADQDIGGEIADVDLKIGSLDDLITQDKTNIVSAINEVSSSDGNGNYGSMHILNLGSEEYAIDTNHDNDLIDFATLLAMARGNDTVVLDYAGFRYPLSDVKDGYVVFSGATYGDDNAVYRSFTLTSDNMAPLAVRTPPSIEVQKNRVNTIDEGAANNGATYPSTGAVIKYVGELKSDIAKQNIVKDSDAEGPDLDFADENGNIVMRLAGGHVYTGNFRSDKIGNLIGKRWVCVGDSLTEVNKRTTVHYHDYIAQETGITVVNMGHSGCGYAKVGGYGKNFIGIAAEIPDDVDVITIFGSGNDMSAGLPLGEITDTDTNTLCGCINNTLNVIYQSHPTTPIGLITPTPWNGSEPSDGESSMMRYSAAIVKICERRGIPCLDLYHCSNLHPSDVHFRTLAYSHDDGDGVHPDETGHRMIYPRFREFVKELI